MNITTNKKRMPANGHSVCERWAVGESVGCALCEPVAQLESIAGAEFELSPVDHALGPSDGVGVAKLIPNGCAVGIAFRGSQHQLGAVCVAFWLSEFVRGAQRVTECFSQ